MIIVFDLDDTLYEEITFVKGGIKAVSKFLENHIHEKSELIYNELMRILKIQGRGDIFDRFLEERDIFSKKLLFKCIYIYRYHDTNIKLYKSASNFLEDNKKNSLYLVTDGNKNVQSHKINSLKLDKYFKKIFITHRYGIRNAKPSLYCFQKIKEKEKCNWKDMVYIGDNPNKDFISLKKVNAKTIRVLTGNFSDTFLSKEYEAEASINSLNELDSEINRMFK